MNASLIVLALLVVACANHIYNNQQKFTAVHHYVRLTAHRIFKVSYPTRQFVFVNSCPYDLWPASLNSTASSTLPYGGGWYLPSGQNTTVVLSPPWSGRFWFRSGCNFSNGAGCDSGDCGRRMECMYAGGSACTLAEFTLGYPDWYDISGVDALTETMKITPFGYLNTNPGYFYSCGSPSNAVDLRPVCPSTLQQRNSRGTVVGCNSGCSAFGTPQYCCTQTYDKPNTCSMNPYAAWFYYNNPTAYSYAYSDSLATFQCAGTQGFIIEACPKTQSPTPPGAPLSPLPLSAFTQTALPAFYPDENSTMPAGWPGVMAPLSPSSPTVQPVAPVTPVTPAWTQAVTAGDLNSVHVSIVVTASWCILHYQIGGDSENVPMVPTASGYTYLVSGPGIAQQSWMYSFTCNPSGGAFDTPQYTYSGKSVSSIQDSIVITAGGALFDWVSTAGSAVQVILHYKINGVQQNVFMVQKSSTEYTYLAPGIRTGTQIQRSYTYTITGHGAQDSLWFTSTV